MKNNLFLFSFAERTRLQTIKETKKKLEDAKHELEVAQRQGQFELASRLRFATIPELERELPKGNEEAEDESPLAMLHDRVTSNDISRVVAKATGIPVQNLLKGERDKLVHVRACNFFFISLPPKLPQCFLIVLIMLCFQDGGGSSRARCWPGPCR